MRTTYWWEIEDENSDLDGEEFFTELEDADKFEHLQYAKQLFPNTNLICCGKVSLYEAERMGLDTY